MKNCFGSNDRHANRLMLVGLLFRRLKNKSIFILTKVIIRNELVDVTKRGKKKKVKKKNLNIMGIVAQVRQRSNQSVQDAGSLKRLRIIMYEIIVIEC